MNKEIMMFDIDLINNNERDDSFPRQQILLCPGPVMVSKNVKKAVLNFEIGHREKEFSDLLFRVRTKLNKVFGDVTSEYTSIVLTGSGTAANESLIASYYGKKVVVLSNGEFGDRLANIANSCGVNVLKIDFGWGNIIDLYKVRDFIATNEVDALITVHHETSTGMLNPIYEIGEILQNTNVDFLVDAISSLGAEKLSVKEANITFCTSTSNKAISSLPGLSFICGKKTAFRKLENQNHLSNGDYLNLFKNYFYEEYHNQTLHTPAVHLFFALETALDELLNDSLEYRFEKYTKLSMIIRKKLKQLGLKFVIPEEHMSRVLTTVFYPNNINVEKFHGIIKNNNYVLYKGKGPYKNKAFQIANIGHISEKEVIGFLDLIESMV